ncbi:MAG: hypothetical protein H6742_14510 [Alphaproteobacteria bacterium]|nr:hypothetical protein [Alphaproteobacteria bacterium]
MTWLLVAAGLTVTVAPQLGLRGLIILGIHHVLCVVGASHEIWRAWKRRKVDQAAG